MSKPVLLIVGSYPDFDIVELEKNYEILKLWEQADKDTFL